MIITSYKTFDVDGIEYTEIKYASVSAPRDFLKISKPTTDFTGGELAVLNYYSANGIGDRAAWYNANIPSIPSPVSNTSLVNNRNIE